VITEYPDFWHFYYNETCEDNPAAILALIEAMFAEMAQMGDIWYLRAVPEIRRYVDFDENSRKAVVWCRFSSKPRVERETPQLLGIGRDNILNTATNANIDCGDGIALTSAAHPDEFAVKRIADAIKDGRLSLTRKKP